MSESDAIIIVITQQKDFAWPQNYASYIVPHPTTAAHSVSLSLPKTNQKEFFQPQSYLRNFFSCFFDDKFFHSEKTGDLCMQKSPDIRVDKFADGVGVCWVVGEETLRYLLSSRAPTQPTSFDRFSFLKSLSFQRKHWKLIVGSPNFLPLPLSQALATTHQQIFCRPKSSLSPSTSSTGSTGVFIISLHQPF